jgi:hypothetical protein
VPSLLGEREINSLDINSTYRIHTLDSLETLADYIAPGSVIRLRRPIYVVGQLMTRRLVPVLGDSIVGISSLLPLSC